LEPAVPRYAFETNCSRGPARTTCTHAFGCSLRSAATEPSDASLALTEDTAVSRQSTPPLSVRSPRHHPSVSAAGHLRAWIDRRRPSARRRLLKEDARPLRRERCSASTAGTGAARARLRCGRDQNLLQCSPFHWQALCKRQNGAAAGAGAGADQQGAECTPGHGFAAWAALTSTAVLFGLFSHDTSGRHACGMTCSKAMRDA